MGRKKKADIVIIELGGTAGEYQNIFYYEASRILTLKNPEDVIHIHVSFVPTPSHLGEPKTKPTQLSVRTLNSMGIQPDFIVGRAEQYLDEMRKKKVAFYCNLDKDAVISNPDCDTVYQVPLIFKEQNFDVKVLKKLGLKSKRIYLHEWKELIDKISAKHERQVKVAIIAKYIKTGDFELQDSYKSLIEALKHASWHGEPPRSGVP